MKTLIGIMKEPRSPAAARVHAAEVILDRGWGKSTQLIAPADDARLAGASDRRFQSRPQHWRAVTVTAETLLARPCAAQPGG
jgi:hypothetical protein